MIKISIIVPIYKVKQEFLEFCLLSLKKQTLQECEFILVSDGAPELENAICNSFASKDSRFRFYKKKHAGVSAARNFGIDKAQGEFITFVDSDDWIEEQSCDLVYQFAYKNKSDIVLWEARQYSTQDEDHPPFIETNRDSLSSLELNDLCQNIIFTTDSKYNSAALVCCKLFKRNLILRNHIKYPQDLTFSEDRIFNINAYSHAKTISYLKKSLYHYRIHPDSISHSYTPDAFHVYTKFISKLSNQQQELYSKAISYEYIRLFFLSWQSYYMHKQNHLSIFQKTRDLSKIIKGEEFQSIVWKHSFPDFPNVIKTELFFFKRKITFPIYLHILKSFIIKLTS